MVEYKSMNFLWMRSLRKFFSFLLNRSWKFSVNGTAEPDLFSFLFFSVNEDKEIQSQNLN